MTDTPRDRFLRLVDELEEAIGSMLDTANTETLSRAASLERHRLARRALVAAYDQASLGVGVQE